MDQMDVLSVSAHISKYSDEVQIFSTCFSSSGLRWERHAELRLRSCVHSHIFNRTEPPARSGPLCAHSGVGGSILVRLVSHRQAGTGRVRQRQSSEMDLFGGFSYWISSDEEEEEASSPRVTRGQQRGLNETKRS